MSTSISCTNCVCCSTVLHGLTGQIAAVLFSLGAYTWVEHSLRAKLSNIMDASIGARKEVDQRKRVGSVFVPFMRFYNSCIFSIGREVLG